jgi:hypothetical protein
VLEVGIVLQVPTPSALPHTWTLKWVYKELGGATKDYKPHTVKDVDYMISVKLPNPETNKLAHEMVARCMMHGPCGAAFPNAPCMEEGKCKKQYPRKFQSETVTDVNGYPIY